MSSLTSHSSTAGVIPYPTSQEQTRLLLLRWNALRSSMSPTVHNELRALTEILSEIGSQQKEFVLRKKQLELKRNKPQISSKKLNTLRSQIQAFQLLTRNLDLPAELQGELLQSVDLPSANERYQGEAKDSSAPGNLSLSSLAAGERRRFASTNKGLPSNDTGASQETIISNRITQRLLELESLPSNIATFNAESTEMLPPDEINSDQDLLKMKAVLELKSLRLLTKQKSLRQHIVYKIASTDNEVIESATTRAANRRVKVLSAKERQLTEQLRVEEQNERMRKEKAVLLNRAIEIVRHAEDIRASAKLKVSQRTQFVKQISIFHYHTEREESKKQEKTAKQRLQALRANDEEAYIKLLDQTKDTRITHLLKQTNTFLDSLAQAVKVQQADGGGAPVPQIREEGDDDEDDGDSNKVTKSVDYYEIAHRIKEHIVKQPSILVGGTLKEYQIKGLEWMVSLYNNNLNGILADEMGLGKTIQSISLITYLIEVKRQPGPYLVIVPLSTLTNWTLEFEKWAPSIKKIVYKGPPNSRKNHQYQIRNGDFQVLLTTYEYIIKDRPVLSKIKWVHMIIDEGHRMKNTQSKLSYTLTQYYYSRHRLILTGTPLQNNLPELWALLNFVLPKIFNSVKTFDEWFNTPFANTGGQDKMELTEEETLLIIRRLHKVLRPFLLRRLKKDVEKDLPDKIERVVKCKMSALQAKLYEHMLKYNVLYIGSESGTGNKSGIRGLNNKIMQLRKICNHPFVFEEVENMINPSRMNNDQLWRTAGKFELLDRILPKFQATNHRCLIFFQMTQVMDIMEDFLRLRGIQYLRLDGSTKADERSEMLKAFNAPDSPYFCFLLSTRAGGLGLNLQTADTVIIYDTDWNPHQDLQAQDRAHRIGQKNEVRILRLITEDSVEEVILERAHAKLEIDGKVIQAGKFDNKSTAEEQEAFLRSLLEAEESKRGDKNDEDDMDDEEMNEILARNDDEKALFSKIDDERNKNGEYNSPLNDKRGKDRLFSYDELPDEYKVDLFQHIEGDNEESLGRGARERKSIHYDDGLTEEQWLDAVDNNKLDEAISKKRSRRERRSTNNSRNGSVAPESDDEDEMNGASGVEEEPSRKRSRRSRASTAATEEVDYREVASKSKAIYDALVGLKDEDGRKICEIFMTVPSKKDYPDYYKVISSPIALDSIRRKIKQEGYDDLQQFVDDVELMIQNAQTFNEEGSWVWNDAATMEETLQSKLRELK